MKIKDIKKDYYKLEKISKHWGMDVDELLDCADDGCPKICMKVFPGKIIPLFSYQARQAIESPKQFVLSNERLLPYGGPIALVISHEEKEKFEKKFGIDTSDTPKGPQKETASGVDKRGIEDLKRIAQDIQKNEKDEDVVAALLRDKHGATAWQLVKVLNIQTSTNTQSSREQAAYRSSKKGRKTIAGREELK